MELSGDFEMMNSTVYIKTEEPFVSEDIWKKFGIDNLDQYAESFDNIDVTPLPLDDEFNSVFEKGGTQQISKMDAMWGGHGVDNSPVEDYTLLLPPACAWISPSLIKAPAPAAQQQQQQSVAAGRSLLIKPIGRPQTTHPNGPMLSSPDSPPISDDEETNKAEILMRFLNEHVGDLDVDEDLYDYITSNERDFMTHLDGIKKEFEQDDDEDVEEEEEEEEEEEDEDSDCSSGGSSSLPTPPPVRPNYAVNDHSYFKDKNASMRLSNLGIDTPSDSEEEIDVVSVEKNNKIGHILPTKPTIQYQEHLERRVQSAISLKSKHHLQQNNNRGRSIKVLPPVRKAPTIQHSQTKRQSEQSRTVKRGRHYYRTKLTNAGYQPYRRKNVHALHGSDSEPELEKRSLHNNMERQRRIDLRNAFEDLRALVPKLEPLERAAKVQILQESKEYCDQLTQNSEDMQCEVMYLKQKQEKLRGRLSFLRKKLSVSYNLK